MIRPRLTPLAAIVLFAFAIRLVWIAWADFQPTLSDDAGRYDFLGRSLAEGGGYVNPNGATTMFWPPGYPFILTAVYKLWPERAFGDHEVTAALVLNAALGAATVALVYAIGRRAFDERAALLGAGITALFPSLIFLSGVTLTETAFTFCALLGVWLLVETEARRDLRLLVLAGAIIGFAALVRGQAALLPLVAAPFWLAATRDLRATAVRVAITGAMVALALLPWTIRNYIESDALVPVASNAGVDLYIGHSDGADGRGRKVDDFVFRYPELPPAEAEARISREGFREGLEYAAKHPLREVELSARKLFWLFYTDREALRWTEAHGERPFLSAPARDALNVLSDVYYYAVLALAVIGAARWASWRRPERLLLLSLAAYWTLVHIAFFADPRFHAPLLPLAALFAAAGIQAARNRFASPTM
ncbi:MAG: glycosyltransferase family 39 protein [Dehalococcoidia bacterium]